MIEMNNKMNVILESPELGTCLIDIGNYWSTGATNYQVLVISYGLHLIMIICYTISTESVNYNIGDQVSLNSTI